MWLDARAELGKTKDIDPNKLSLTTTSYLAGCYPRNKLSRLLGEWVGWWVGGIGNKAQLRPAKLELGLA